MKRIFAVIMALMMILSTTSQAYVVTVYGQNCTYTMTSPANRKITLSDKQGNVRWWKVEDTSNNIIGAIDGKFVTPSSDVEVTPMLTGNQIVVQQTANGTIKYNGNVVNTVETTENQSYTLAITPNSGYEIATVKVDNVELSGSEITASGMNYAFNNVTANHVITATYKRPTLLGDVNEDGTVNLVDIGIIARYLKGLAIANINLVNADINIDNMVDRYDSNILMEHLGDIEGFETLPYTGKVVLFVSDYSSNDGVSADDIQAFTTGETKALSANTFTKEGYTFAGWTTTEGGTTVEYADGANFTANANTTLYAVWEEAITPPNAPVITTGLTPVNWENNSWVITTEANWDYDYNSVAETTSNGTVAGKWANAQTADGSLYVWIPRYTYKITTGNHSSGNSWNSQNGNAETGNKIEIKFSNGTTDNNTDSYLSHPAFTFGSTPLKGIWVAKYEASQGNTTNELSVPTASSYVAKSVPGVSSWRSITVSKMFDYAYNTFRNADSHLMKNVEWGAVAYLTNAIGRIPYINNSSSYITGNAGGSQDAGEASGVTNAWNTVNGVKASTTHNVYGIYDLSGGAWKYVAAYVNNGNSYASSLVNSYSSNGTKYVDVYPVGTSDSEANNYAAWSNIKGDAVYETSSSGSGPTSWDGDFLHAPYSDFPVFLRGGCYFNTSGAGVFCFYRSNGLRGSSCGFRPVLAIP